MATNVQQTYTSGLNVSITTRDGVISLVSLWVTGDSATQTKREGQTADQWRNPFPLRK